MTEPLARAVTTPLLYLFILGDVLGAGIYVLIGQIAGVSGSAVWVPLVVALVLAMLTAASYAELATKYPRAGGAAHYAHRAFGPFTGFVIGFCMLAAGVVSVAALARGFGGDYLGEFVDLPPVPVIAVFLLVLAALNVRGIKDSLRANMVATLIETGGLVLVIGLGLWVIGRGDAEPARLVELGTAERGPVAGVLAGAVLAYYSFVGFETSVNVAEETKDPRRSYPRALFGAMATAGLLYLLVGVVAGAVVPASRLAESSGPLLEVVRVAGGVPPWVFGVIALVAVANGALLTSIMSSRLAYGMARDRLLPSVLTKTLRRRRTPWVAIVATSGLSLGLALTGEIAVLASTLVLLLLIVFAAVNTAVLVLRKDTQAVPHFRVPSVLPVLGLGSCVLLATQIEAAVWLRGGVLVAIALLLAVVHAVVTRRRAPHPDASHADRAAG
ncbi:APC family permease [Amycolatopsis regifaucium]|uniref:Amino acid permease n=1 Tax=Amycolatopsis regifaucium TaxID=546365 RepID=A0A154M484_9PSEU|nr:APC family permease [Amycolatopsis regifaucium]KZB79230.1 amino acid permease [Amycolatopsis regifaucium]OKA07413.1 amino acid permease [Amycolatopsis regifaucium]SFH12022.1 Amino acid transporter [Amycolatopsis regifaucium]